LQTWTPVSTNWVDDGFVRFIDPMVANGRRFYRVSIGP
jgi:hypothetical protein